MLAIRPLTMAAPLLTMSVLCSASQAQLTPTFADVPYGDGHAAQRLDVYVPTGTPDPAGARACVVWIHGGGWQNGDKFPAGKAPSLLNLGIAVASVNYRLSGVAPHPAQIHDCKAAIRHLRASAATYGIDPDRIGVWGSSAGGHLVALLGTSGNKPELEGTVGPHDGLSSAVAAVADYFGPADFLSITTAGHLSCNSPESRMLGVCLGDVVANQTDPDWADELAVVLAASPTAHIDPADPPFYIAHGTADPVVEVAQSVTLHNQLLAAGVPSTLRLVQGAGHGLPPIEDVPARKFLAAALGVTICPGDWNANGSVGVQDVFDYLAAYFAGNPAADVNGGGLSVQDLFDMLAAYFAACG